MVPEVVSNFEAVAASTNMLNNFLGVAHLVEMSDWSVGTSWVK